MKAAPLPADKIQDEIGVTDKGYLAWKHAKIERGLVQARDRGTLIPAEQVWRDLDLEG